MYYNTYIISNKFQYAYKKYFRKLSRVVRKWVRTFGQKQFISDRRIDFILFHIIKKSKYNYPLRLFFIKSKFKFFFKKYYNSGRILNSYNSYKNYKINVLYTKKFFSCKFYLVKFNFNKIINLTYF